MPSKVPTSIDELYKQQLKKDPVNIIQEIDDDLQSFMKVIIENDSETVIICGRKSNLLYSKYISDIISSDKRVLSLETIGENNVWGFTGRGKILILSDSIHKGTEFEKIQAFIIGQVGIENIGRLEAMCLAAYQDGINKVEEYGIKWDAHFFFEDEVEYSEYMRNLDVYFQNLPGHLETDIPYDRFYIQTADFGKCESHALDSVSQAFCENVEIIADSVHVLPDLRQYSIRCRVNPQNDNCLRRVPIIQRLKNIQDYSHRFILKIKSENERIIITTQYDTYLTFSLDGIKKAITEDCRLGYVIDEKRCGHLRVNFDRRKINLKSIICAICVGNKICEGFLDNYQNIFLKTLEKGGLISEVTRIRNNLLDPRLSYD